MLAKLARWLEQQENEPTLLDVIETGDVELGAAFILKRFRAAARRAAIKTILLRNREWSGERAFGGTPGLFQAFETLSSQWELSTKEKLALLGVDSPKGFGSLQKMSLEELPIDVIERISMLLTIESALQSLLPNPSAAKGWVKRANKAPLFAGRSALAIMIENGAGGIRNVEAYLLAQLYGS